MKIKKITLGIVVFLACVILSGCGRAKTQTDQWQRIKSEKKIIIGLDDTFVPMGFQNKSGKIVGYDIDLARAVFKLYAIKVDFQAIDWSMKENELQNQTIDLIWNGYTKSPEREKKVAFTRPYLKNEQVLVTLKKSDINSFSQMQGKILGAQNGSAGYDALLKQPQVLKQYIKGEPILYDGFNEAFMDLQTGRIQGLLIDQIYAGYYLQQEKDGKDFQVIKGGFSSEDFAVGVRQQDDKLRQKINHAFAILEQNGELEKINQKWFGK